MANRPWLPSEDALLRELYGTIPIRELAARVGRPVPGTYRRAGKLKLRSRARWNKVQDERLRELWGTVPMSTLAMAFRRTMRAVYAHAHRIGLPLGVLDGYELLYHAAKRNGFSVAQLRVILATAGVPVLQTASRPRPWKRKRPRRHMALRSAVDHAVKLWLETEAVGPAARSRNMCDATLRRLLRLARKHGFELPPEPKHRAPWRVPTKTIDAVIAWRSGGRRAA